MTGRKPFEEASCWDAASQSSILLGKISQTPGGIMMGVIFSLFFIFFLFNKIKKLQLSFANYIFLLNFLLMKLINRSVRLWNFFDGGSKRKLLYFVNTINDSSSKGAKMSLSKSIFYFNNHPNFLRVWWFLAKINFKPPSKKFKNLTDAKGQLISEWIFDVFNFPKDQPKNFCPRI